MTGDSVLLCGQPGERPCREAQSLRDAYRSADHPPGCGNLAATLAVLAAAGGDLASAGSLLEMARDDYTTGRPDARPIASGEALLRAIQRLLDRLHRWQRYPSRAHRQWLAGPPAADLGAADLPAIHQCCPFPGA